MDGTRGGLARSETSDAQAADGVQAAGVESRLPGDRAEQRIIARRGGRDQVGEQEPHPRLVAPAQPGPGQQGLGGLAGRQVGLDGAPEERVVLPGRVGEAAVAGAGRDLRTGRPRCWPSSALSRAAWPVTSRGRRASPPEAAAASCPAGTGAAMPNAASVSEQVEPAGRVDRLLAHASPGPGSGRRPRRARGLSARRSWRIPGRPHLSFKNLAGRTLGQRIDQPDAAAGTCRRPPAP